MSMTIKKALVGTVAAGAMAVTSASPAMARDHRDKIDAGDVIAGALIIGGIAAIASAAGKKDRYRDYDDYRYRDRDGYRDYDRRGYRGRGYARDAVEQCVYKAERRAGRLSYGGRADVTDIRDVDRIRGGYKIKGRIAVNTRGYHRGYRGDRYRDRGHYDRGYYGRGWGNDWRGVSKRYRNWDAGRFTCKVRHGRVVDIDFHGIRGL